MAREVDGDLAGLFSVWGRGSVGMPGFPRAPLPGLGNFGEESCDSHLS